MMVHEKKRGKERSEHGIWKTAGCEYPVPGSQSVGRRSEYIRAKHKRENDSSGQTVICKQLDFRFENLRLIS